ncbi:MAG: peptidylprolyl isomerase [Bdellovibrionales bacterium]|nr:peptidylprolyl isomerase [Bdellovibrionales bacterium]
MRRPRNRWIFFALVIVATGSVGSIAWAETKVVDRLEASVNSNIILQSDIRRFRETVGLRSKLDPLFAASALGEHLGTASDKEIVSALIHDRLILQAFPVSDSDVESEINAIQSNQRISRERLREELQKNGFRFNDYFELIRLSTAKRNLIDREIRARVSVSDDDVKNHFYNHYSKQSPASRSYRVKIIIFSRSNFKSAKALQETAERASTALKSGDSFEEVARRYSDDSSSESGGDLGALTEDQMSPAIRKEVKKLKVGGVSPIFGDSSSRLFILKLADVLSVDDSRLAAVKEEIRNQIAAGEYHRQIQLWLDRQEQQAFIHRAPES